MVSALSNVNKGTTRKRLFNPVNQDYIDLSSAITANTNEPIKIQFYLTSVANQFDIYSESDSSSDDRITMLSGGVLAVQINSILVNTGLPLSTGLVNLELNYNEELTTI